MQDPKYLVTISPVPSQPIGTQPYNVAGVTYSMPAYSDEYFIASMPELGISATGSSYGTALTNLLAVATSSTVTSNGHIPYNKIRYW